MPARRTFRVLRDWTTPRAPWRSLPLGLPDPAAPSLAAALGWDTEPMPHIDRANAEMANLRRRLEARGRVPKESTP